MRESFFEKMTSGTLFKSTSTESVNEFRESTHIRRQGSESLHRTKRCQNLQGHLVGAAAGRVENPHTASSGSQSPHGPALTSRRRLRALPNQSAHLESSLNSFFHDFDFCFFDFFVFFVFFFFWFFAFFVFFVTFVHFPGLRIYLIFAFPP